MLFCCGERCVTTQAGGLQLGATKQQQQEAKKKQKRIIFFQEVRREVGHFFLLSLETVSARNEVLLGYGEGSVIMQAGGLQLGATKQQQQEA